MCSMWGGGVGVEGGGSQGNIVPVAYHGQQKWQFMAGDNQDLARGSILAKSKWSQTKICFCPIKGNLSRDSRTKDFFSI